MAQQDTNKTCVQNWKLDFFIQEHVRAKELRLDTFHLNHIVESQIGVITQKDVLLKQDSAILAVKDSTTLYWQNHYNIESTKHKKDAKGLENSKLLNKLLGVVTVTLILVLAITL